jgi:alkylation response protein AidB-like acyl-CoA dehydrogenase
MSRLDDLTPREQRIANLAQSLGREFAEGAARHDRDGSFAHAHYRRLHEAGYLRLAIPRPYGGGGASIFELVLAQEKLAAHDAATAVGVGMLLNVVGREAEFPSWPEPVRERFFTTLARDGGIANSVVTEAGLGSISRGGRPATEAKRVAGGWRISGHKIFVTAAPALRYLLVGIALPPSAATPSGEIARAIVEAPAEGLRIEPTWAGNLSQRAGGSDDVFFDDVFVPDDWVVERQPFGAPTAPAPNGWWLGLSAVYLGVAQGALDAASDYANHRAPSALGGEPIARVPHIQQAIGQIAIRIDAARALLHATARRWSDHAEDRPVLGARIAAAKHFVTNTACEVTELALRVAGGFSLGKELTLERHFRDARAGLFQPPQDDLALGLVGRERLAQRLGREAAERADPAIEEEAPRTAA